MIVILDITIEKTRNM